MKIENTVQVQEKSVYGVTKLYPANSLADKLAAFKGQKTLTEQDIYALKDMGFHVELVYVPKGKLVGVVISEF
jgi:hypothetical protein